MRWEVLERNALTSTENICRNEQNKTWTCPIRVCVRVRHAKMEGRVLWVSARDGTSFSLPTARAPGPLGSFRSYSALRSDLGTDGRPTGWAWGRSCASRCSRPGWASSCASPIPALRHATGWRGCVVGPCPRRWRLRNRERVSRSRLEERRQHHAPHQNCRQVLCRQSALTS